MQKYGYTIIINIVFRLVWAYDILRRSKIAAVANDQPTGLWVCKILRLAYTSGGASGIWGCNRQNQAGTSVYIILGYISTKYKADTSTSIFQLVPPIFDEARSHHRVYLNIFLFCRQFFYHPAYSIGSFSSNIHKPGCLFTWKHVSKMLFLNIPRAPLFCYF